MLGDNSRRALLDYKMDTKQQQTAAPGSSDGPLWGAGGMSHYGKCHKCPPLWSLTPGQAAKVTQHDFTYLRVYKKA